MCIPREDFEQRAVWIWSCQNGGRKSSWESINLGVSSQGNFYVSKCPLRQIFKIRFTKSLLLWVSDAARRGEAQGARATMHVREPHRTCILLFFCKILQKNNVLSYLQNEVSEIRGENWNLGVLENLGALRRYFNFFSAKFYEKNVLSYLQNEVVEIRGENWNWGALKS